MKTFLKNYKQTLILIVAIIIGAIAGLILGEKATVLSPFGTVFVNLLYMIIVPLIFLTVSTSISKISQPKRVGKILGTIVLVFAITSLASVMVGLLAAYPANLVSSQNAEILKEQFGENIQETDVSPSVLSTIANKITTDDFSKLFSKDSIVAIIVFAILFGMAMRNAGEKAKPVLSILESLTEVIASLIKIIMLYAPIGIGCYFAALVGTFGSGLAMGYLKTFIIYTIACVFVFFFLYTFYAFIAGGKLGVKKYWANILPATFTALATCSSAASIPVNLQSAKGIGVSDDIAETLIPLGTSFHKDGSIIGSVFKAMFLVCLFGANVYTLGGIGQILVVSLVATLFIVAVPIGGSVSEVMIITMLGYPPATLPLLQSIAAVIDAPATVLNVVGDSASSMLAARIIDGKDWINKAK